MIKMLQKYICNKLYFQNLIPFKCFYSFNSSFNYVLILIFSIKLAKGFNQS
jgi:hypothetical protein